MPKTRRWNLNEHEARYAATNLTETAVDLHLGLKRTDGTRVPVGRYLLDLQALSDRGFVTRRQTREGTVFDVQIYRDLRGRYLLGVRQDETTPLDAFAHR